MDELLKNGRNSIKIFCFSVDVVEKEGGGREVSSNPVGGHFTPS